MQSKDVMTSERSEWEYVVRYWSKMCTSGAWCERIIGLLALYSYAGQECVWFHLFSSCLQPSINTTNIDTLLVATDQTERIVEPPDNVQEKIAFIFNNLSQSNMTQKVQEADMAWWDSHWVIMAAFSRNRLFCQVEELKETVKDEFMPWVSQYLVMKRVSIEPNFHSLYSNFLDTLKNPEFVKMVLNETYRNIKVGRRTGLFKAFE